MGLMSFYKPKKPSKFRYVYRYYDPKKEELERKVRRAERRLNPDAPLKPEEVKENIRGSFRQQSKKLARYGGDEHVQETLTEKSYRYLIVLGLLLALFFWLVRSSGVQQFFGFFGYYF